MADFSDARAKLANALNRVPPDGPEWIKINAAIAALDQAQAAQVGRDFINSTRRLGDAVAKLKSLTASLKTDPASALVGDVKGALKSMTPLVQDADALLSGEPATALPGMVEANKASFPSDAEPSVPPVREFARDIAQRPASDVDGGAAVDAMIADILKREGGFVDHPNDRGGPTNFGITLRTLASWRKTDVTRDDVRRMDAAEARDIYKGRYYLGPQLNRLPAALQPVIFDMCINHGPASAIKMLQEVLQSVSPPCDTDGGIGDQTVKSAAAALSKLGAKDLVNRIVDRRVALFKAIVAKDPSQGVFLKGWLRRAEEFRR